MRLHKFKTFETFEPKKMAEREAEAKKKKILPRAPKKLQLDTAHFRNYNAKFAKVFGDDHEVSGSKKWTELSHLDLEFYDTDANGTENQFLLSEKGSDLDITINVDLTKEFNEPWDKKLSLVADVHVYLSDTGELKLDPSTIDRVAEFLALHIVDNIHAGTSGMLDEDDDLIRKKYSDYMYDVLPKFTQKVKAKLAKTIKGE